MRAGGTDAATAARGIGLAADQAARLRRATGTDAGLAQQARDAQRSRRALGHVVNELKKIRVELTRISAVSRRAGTSMQRAGRRGATAARQGERGFRRLRQEIRRTESGADRLTASFLRMGGIISAFVIGGAIIRGLSLVIEQSIQFNRTIERTELGIAAILTAVGQIRGPLGESVDASKALALAQAEARRQTQLLRKDALTTAATFEQLLDTFQIALAPGLAAGLQVDEVRQFAIRISQAATALGVAQNQLSEEIRSILSATIRPQTTRIAVALGITNEQVRRARELGQLYEFLTTRFNAFGAAGEKALTTIDGLVGRIIDGFAQLAGAAGQELFDDIKAALNEILGIFIEFDQFGFPQPDPRTLTVLREFFAVFQEAFQRIRESLKEVTFEDAVIGAQRFAEAIISAVEVVIGLVQGLVDGFSSLGGIIREVAELLGFDTQEKSLRDIVRTTTAILVNLVAIRAIFGLIGGIILPIVATLKVVFGLLARMVPILVTQATIIRSNIARGFALWPVHLQRAVRLLIRFAAAIAAIGLAVNLLIRAFTGISLNIEETIDVIVLSFRELWARIVFGFKASFGQVVNFLANIFRDPIGTIAREFNDLFAALIGGGAAVLAALGIISEEARQSAEETLAVLDKLTKPEKKPVVIFDVSEAKAELDKDLEDIDKEFEDIVKKNAERQKKDKEGQDEVTDALKGTIDALKAENTEAKSLAETIERITTTFSTARTAISDVAGETERLRKAQERFDVFRAEELTDLAIPDVSGPAAAQARAVQAELLKNSTALQTITRRTLEIERDRVRAGEAVARSERELATLRQDEQDIIQEIQNSVAEVVRLSRLEAEAISQAALLRVEQRDAAREGDDDRLRALRDQEQRLLSQLDVLREQREAAEKVTETQGALLSDEAQQVLLERLEALSREAALSQDIAELQEKINDLRDQSARITRLTAEDIARQNIPALQRQNVELRIQEGLEKTLNSLERAGASEARRRLAELRSEGNSLRIRNQFEEDALRVQIEQTEQIIERSGAIRAAEPSLFAQLDLLKQQLRTVEEINKAEEERLLREIGLQQMRTEGGLVEGIELGVLNFVEAIGTVAEQLEQLTQGLLNTISSGISSALVRGFVAFGQSGEIEDFWAAVSQGAAQVLQQLATQILQTAINLLLQRILSNVAADTARQAQELATAGQVAAIEQASAISAATTKVTAAQTAAAIEISAATTAAAIRAASGGAGVGVAGGGYISPNLPQSKPPPGIPKSDRVRAFLTPGEFVQTADAVRTYGVDVMEALRRKIINPDLLRNLSGLRGLRGLRALASRGPAFQQGGLVSEQVQTAVDQATSSAPTAELVGAVIPANNSTLEKLLGGGIGAFKRFLRENATEFDGILSTGRIGG